VSRPAAAGIAALSNSTFADDAVVSANALVPLGRGLRAYVIPTVEVECTFRGHPEEFTNWILRRNGAPVEM